jgi:hypothetical protein
MYCVFFLAKRQHEINNNVASKDNEMNGSLTVINQSLSQS